MTALPAPHREVVELSVADDPRWSALLEQKRSDVFHSPAWAQVLEDTYGFSVRAHVILDDGRPVAGLPFVEVDDPRGTRIVSLPFSDFSDPLIDDRAQWELLQGELADLPATVRCLRTEIEPGTWQETGSFAWHRVDVTRAPEQAWEAIHSSARRAIRKAGAAGVEVTEAETEDDLRAFFEMHLRVRKHKYGLLAQPYRFFLSIWERFLAEGNGRLLLARADSRVVGGVLCLDWGDTVYYKFNASQADGLSVRPNDLLVWEGLTRAHQAGMKWFDFGVSDWDQEGLVRYKRKYATEEGVVRKYSRGPALADELGPLLGRVTELLVDPDVPDRLTERAGDLVYRYFC